MAKIISDTTLQAWADAIREKEGSTGSIKVSDMAQRILDLASGGGEFLGGAIETGTVTTISIAGLTIPHSLGTIKGFVILGNGINEGVNYTMLYYCVNGEVSIAQLYADGSLGTYEYTSTGIETNANNNATLGFSITVDIITEYSYLLIGA